MNPPAHPEQPLCGVSKGPFTLARVTALIAAIRGPFTRGALVPGACLTALGLDSLDRQTLACELDEAFHIEIPDAPIAEWRTVEDVARTVETLRTKETA